MYPAFASAHGPATSVSGRNRMPAITVRAVAVVGEGQIHGRVRVRQPNTADLKLRPDFARKRHLEGQLPARAEAVFVCLRVTERLYRAGFEVHLRRLGHRCAGSNE
jgi:hypothetical protein